MLERGNTLKVLKSEMLRWKVATITLWLKDAAYERQESRGALSCNAHTGGLSVTLFYIELTVNLGPEFYAWSLSNSFLIRALQG